MPDDPSCQAPRAPTGAVPRTCVPFAHVPAVPVMAVPYVPVPVPSGLPVLSVSGILPDRAGNVDVSQFLSSWAAEFAAAKADKASPAAAGNLASLDASGNLVDSGATPASIKAAAVAEVVANAPGTMDTLKEIADILGSNQASGSVLKRILDLESGKVNKEAGKGLVAVDAALATSGAAADAKAVGDVLRGGFTEWEFSGNLPPGVTYTVDITEYEGPVYVALLIGSDGTAETDRVDSLDVESVSFTNSGITATRRLITPTKTSQLENDGAPNGGGTPYATIAQIPDVTSKAGKAANATAGNLASLDSSGNLADSGAKASDFAAKADLPYSLVTPGEWEFSDGQSHEIGSPEDVFEYGWAYAVKYLGYSQSFSTEADALAALSLTFDGSDIIATRATLPGHLLDRAGNRVVVTGDSTLTLPAAVPGYARDFLVRLEISGSTVPTITFAAPTGETITYETDGDEFPVPDEAGTWLYAFTETDTSTFAVSLKKVNVVAQGGGT